MNDGPASLAAVLITLAQSFSMNTLGTMSMWLDLISSEVDELAVSKHTSQAKELWRVLNVIKDYALPTQAIVANLFEQAIQHRAELAAQQEERELEEELQAEEEEATVGTPGGTKKEGGGSGAKKDVARRSVTQKKPPKEKERPGDSSDSSSGSESEAEDNGDGGRKLARRTDSPGATSESAPPRSSFAIRNLGTIMMKRRTTYANTPGGEHGNAIQLSFAILPHGSHNMPVSVEVLEPFFGENINVTCQNLEMILEGDESLEVQGARYWVEQLQQLEQSVSKVKEDIHASLEEKRNFFSFILTVVTVFLAPLTILTGYWGMNFDNMIELDSSSYSILPGVKLLWFVGTCVYTMFLCLSIHFRVLYSAT